MRKLSTGKVLSSFHLTAKRLKKSLIAIRAVQSSGPMLHSALPGGAAIISLKNAFGTLELVLLALIAVLTILVDAPRFFVAENLFCIMFFCK